MEAYYIDSAGLGHGNNALALVEDCQELHGIKCADGEKRNLWRLPNKEAFDAFVRRAKEEQWPARAFYGPTAVALPVPISTQKTGLTEPVSVQVRRARRPSKRVFTKIAFAH
jgi:hypothetical protein